MGLPNLDVEYLARRGFEYTVASECNMTCVIIRAYPLPVGYDRAQADLLIRLSPGYPDVAPDMWWFDPAVKPADGRSLPATNSVEPYLGRSWQRWSRHFRAGQWMSGIDSLESFLALINNELERSVPEQVL